MYGNECIINNRARKKKEENISKKSAIRLSDYFLQ